LADAELREQLDYVVPLGIPLFFFLGGPPGWTDLDRGYALAWRRLEAEKCGQCHVARREWLDVNGKMNPVMFTAAVRTCNACALLEAKAAKAPERRHGLKTVLYRTADLAERIRE
jgi:hypothetical protein